ncbi:C-type mannose receptor 2-like isoform X2 [Dicentrarchus labrax]|uniref:C-type lectin domain-containing protein n=1 Tax=Dicentrarchus labrax TaxID=13489 RepID=A0A8P4G7G5_DICLA|nr:C-type mannose receptor 2-like isoform X2 [Dicentrarchus labrax]
MKSSLSVLFLTGLCSLTYCFPLQYHFISTALPWLDARKYCRGRYTDLATVYNIEDVKRLVNSTGGFTEMAWIGLQDNVTGWRWSDSRYYGNKEFDYRNWDYVQPNNLLGSERCVMMWSTGAWHDSQCSKRNSYICYDESTRSTQPFVFVEQQVGWPEAQQYCRERHTDLASVRGEKENQEIQSLAKGSSAWIGLNRILDWSDQSDSPFRYWKQGQPDDARGKQHCIAADLGKEGLWSDEECSRELFFICYGGTPVTPNKITTTEEGSTATEINSEITPPEQPPTPEVVDQTGPMNETPNQRVLSTTEMPTTEGDSSRTEVSSQQYSTPDVDQTSSIPEHVITLRVKLSSKTQLSDDDINELLYMLRKEFLPESTKFAWKRIPK